MEDSKKLVATLSLLLGIFVVLFGIVTFLYMHNKRSLESRIPKPDVVLESKQIKLFVPEEAVAKSAPIQSGNLMIKPVAREGMPAAGAVNQSKTPSAIPSSGKVSFEAVTVFDIQAALKNGGYDPGALDGKMGPRTKDAVRKFQKAHGLVVDGVVGRNTWEKLSAYTVKDKEFAH